MSSMRRCSRGCSAEGVVYLSNAVIGSRFALRACIVNFRTSLRDIGMLIDATIAAGREVDREKAGGRGATER